MDERRLAVYRAAIHPSLAVAIPFLFLVLLDLLLRVVVLDLVLPPNPPGTILVLLLTGGAQAAVANTLAREKVGGGLPRLRELLVILVLAAAVFMTTRGYLFAGDVNPAKPEVIYALLLVLIMWLTCFSLHRAFREREVFLSTITGIDGNELRTAVRSYSTEATESVARMRQVKRVVIWFQLLVLLAFCAALLGGREVGAGLLLLVVLHLALGLAYTAALNGYQEEQGYFGGGFVLPALPAPPPRGCRVAVRGACGRGRLAHGAPRAAAAGQLPGGVFLLAERPADPGWTARSAPAGAVDFELAGTGVGADARLRADDR